MQVYGLDPYDKYPLYDRAGDVASVVSEVRDITERETISKIRPYRPPVATTDVQGPFSDEMMHEAVQDHRDKHLKTIQQEIQSKGLTGLDVDLIEPMESLMALYSKTKKESDAFAAYSAEAMTLPVSRL